MPAFPTLTTVMALLESDNGHGMCFHRSAALCYDLPGSTLVFGTFRAATEAERAAEPLASDCEFIHAWVEHKGWVFAPTTIERFGALRALDKSSYYKANAARNMRRMSRRDLLQIFKQKPELLQQLQTGKRPSRDGLLVDTLLNAVKLPFHIAPDSGVLPGKG